MSENCKKMIPVRDACNAFVDRCLADARDISSRNIAGFHGLMKNFNAELNINSWQLTVHTFPVILVQNSQAIKNIFCDRADEILEELDKSILKKAEFLYNDPTKAENFLGSIQSVLRTMRNGCC